MGGAIWTLGMTLLEEGLVGPLWESKEFQAKATALIDEFVQVAGGLECLEITGQEFDNVEDHAAFLHQGGCAEVIEFLAAKMKE